MQELDSDLRLGLLEQEIEEAERFASEYRLLIDARLRAGQDMMLEECMLEQFRESLRRVSDVHALSPSRARPSHGQDLRILH
jgi:hypothetical protein